MKRKIKCTGLMVGTTMMLALAGNSAAFGAKEPAKTQAATETAATKEEETVKDKKPGEKEVEKKTNLYYGRVKKIEQGKLTLDEAAVAWEKDAAADTKNTGDNKKGTETKDTKDTKDTGENMEVQADFGTAAMKWKLDGKMLEVAIGKETIICMETASEGKADQNNTGGNADQKDAKASDEKTDKKDKTDKKQKTEAKNVNNVKVESIKLEDIKEGNLVKVVLKDDGSMTASEVVLLADAKEIKPVEQQGDKAAEAQKQEGNENTAKKDDKKKK